MRDALCSPALQSLSLHTPEGSPEPPALEMWRSPRSSALIPSPLRKARCKEVEKEVREKAGQNVPSFLLLGAWSSIACTRLVQGQRAELPVGKYVPSLCGSPVPAVQPRFSFTGAERRVAVANPRRTRPESWVEAGGNEPRKCQGLRSPGPGYCHRVPVIPTGSRLLPPLL